MESQGVWFTLMLGNPVKIVSQRRCTGTCKKRHLLHHIRSIGIYCWVIYFPEITFHSFQKVITCITIPIHRIAIKVTFILVIAFMSTLDCCQGNMQQVLWEKLLHLPWVPRGDPSTLSITLHCHALPCRVPSHKCREEVQQIYCSFLYHDKGLCLPPFLVAPGQVRTL